jgi:hypothetical protein
MKFIKAAFSLLFFLIGIFALSQDMPDPDFTVRPYYVDGNDLKAFEKTEATIETKTKGLGYGGFDVFYAVPGTKSTVRFSQGIFPKVIVKMEDGGDPSESFFISSASDIKKDRRRFKSSKVGGVFNKSTDVKERIKFSAKKIRDRVYELIPEAPLIPGEFAIVNTLLMKVYCFGVD